MRTLREIYRTAGHRPFVASHQGRIAWFLGFGPNNKIIGWWTGTDQVLEMDAEERSWTFVAPLQGV